MVILDVSVVNVALPSIRSGLHFTEQDLQWVVNAYTVTFAGFLLLGGRAADLLGRRRVFVVRPGAVRPLLARGRLRRQPRVLIIARAVQGLGGAVIAPASLSILTSTFTEGAARNRAVGIWGAMGGAGGAAGVLLGGILTSSLNWRWILFINVPIGLAAAVASFRLLSEGRDPERAHGHDLPGALTATLGLSVLVFGIVRTDVTGWGSAPTLALIIGGIAILGLFLLIEGRFAASPLMPLRIYRSRTLSASNLVVLLVGGATFGMWFFLSLYLQQVLGYSPIRAGLAFLPMTICIVVGSTIASRLVIRVGAKTLLLAGMLAQTAGLLLFSGVSAHGQLPLRRARAEPAGRDRHRLRVRPGDDQRRRRRPPPGGGPRLGPGEHEPDVRRRARPGDPRGDRHRAHQPRPACGVRPRAPIPRSPTVSSSRSSSPQRSPSSARWSRLRAAPDPATGTGRSRGRASRGRRRRRGDRRRVAARRRSGPLFRGYSRRARPHPRPDTPHDRLDPQHQRSLRRPSAGTGIRPGARSCSPASDCALCHIGSPCSSPCKTGADHGLIFDEAYYVNAARVIDGIHPPPGVSYADAPLHKDPNAEHPQLAKLIIAGGIKVFGDNPWGWRLGSVLFGMIALIAL